MERTLRAAQRRVAGKEVAAGGLFLLAALHFVTIASLHRILASQSGRSLVSIGTGAKRRPEKRLRSEAPTMRFVLGNHATHWRDIERLDESDIERQPQRFVGGRNSWIAQTYLRLRAPLERRGWKVAAGGSFIPGAIALAHRDDANDLLSGAAASFLVVVRADRAAVVACDIAIIQNQIAPSPRERYVPLWPQPGLRPREAGRGQRIERVAYHGRHAPPWFFEAPFVGALASRGIRFEVKRGAVAPVCTCQRPFAVGNSVTNRSRRFEASSAA